MKIKVNDYIAQFLRVQGIKHVFEVTGGMITQLLDAIYQLDETHIISMHHEQAVAFAVDAYSRFKKNPSVAFATSGPGATNLLTGIASCYFDSSPGIFITGQVNTHEQKGNKNIRQLGFQETDIISMANVITKKTFSITHTDQVERVMQEAYEIAINDRPGPVLIDLPMNIQRAEIEVNKILPIYKKIKKLNFNPNIDDLIDTLKSAERPLILAGGGINSSAAINVFLKWVELIDVPVVTTLLGLDTIPYDHPLRVGFIGTYGNRWANLTIGQCDLLIVIGSRLDIRQTGSDVIFFSNNKKIFHIDCDINEVNNRVKGCIPIIMDINNFIEQFEIQSAGKKFFQKKSWINEISKLQKQWPDTKEQLNISGINPNSFMHTLSKKSGKAAGYIADVGNHQMWAAQSLEICSQQFFITSGGMGAMGFALPAAIGACFASDRKPIVVISGDGGFQLNIQELQTIFRNKLPIKIIVVNNNSLGMIRQFQDNYFDGRYQSTSWGYSAPSFELIAKAYGIDAHIISSEKEINTGIDLFWADETKPFLLEVIVDFRVNAFPKIAFGKPITEMEPLARPVEMEGT